MVLQSNYAKRYVSNAENTPPTLSAAKSLASRLRNNIQQTSRRRRARTSGTSDAKYAVDQAKRRSTKSTAPVRFNVKSRSAASPTDVEMKDAEPERNTSSSSSNDKNVQLLLPRTLERPDYCEVKQEALVAVDPLFVDVNPSYLREQIREFGPTLLAALGTVKPSPVKDSLPKDLSLLIEDLATSPTHMLAVHGGAAPRSGAPKRRKVTLYPAHSIVFAAHCSKLPAFPPTTSPTPENEESYPMQISVPVRPLCLPSPETYPQLASFLYTKQTIPLLNSLLPCPIPTNLDEEGQQQVYAKRLGMTYTVPVLLHNIAMVLGLWKNVCALGVFDHLLWDTMDQAWEILLNALAVGTGTTIAVDEPTPASS
ncbi:hypothetical protein BDQ12DRAFT_671646 [Crucibulum laeve]|uniref:Clp1-like protein n=1 Tax=Crucibulum laeve TaxID=68775 RepID=A0A5C3LF31_9AGAR|nr:hypothetical protein BDQ12DRAFT_671646 [Crucibulum laeve]